MNHKHLEFVIAHSVKGASGKVTVIGRCGGEPISKGDHFDRILKYQKRDYPHGLEQPPTVEKQCLVSVDVEKINAYGKDLEQLPAGWTGCLIFDERQTDLLPVGWILSSNGNPG